MVKNLNLHSGSSAASFLHSEILIISDCYFCAQKQHDDNFIFGEKKSW